jgi:hypothetical protein
MHPGNCLFSGDQVGAAARKCNRKHAEHSVMEREQ